MKQKKSLEFCHRSPYRHTKTQELGYLYNRTVFETYSLLPYLSTSTIVHSHQNLTHFNQAYALS